MRRSGKRLSRGVLFDLDGVLVDSFDAWLELSRAAIRDLGDGRELTREAFVPTLGTPIEEDVARWFPTRTVGEVQTYYEEHFFDHAKHVRVDEDAIPLLEWLRSQNKKLAIVTNSPTRIARRIVEVAKLPVEIVLSGSEVPRGKPAPDLLLHALERLALDARDALMIGDTDNDRLAAKAADVRFVGLRLPCEERIEHLRDLRSILR